MHPSAWQQSAALRITCMPPVLPETGVAKALKEKGQAQPVPGTEAAREKPEGFSRLPKALPRYQRQGMSEAACPGGTVLR